MEDFLGMNTKLYDVFREKYPNQAAITRKGAGELQDTVGRRLDYILATLASIVSVCGLCICQLLRPLQALGMLLLPGFGALQLSL